MVYDGLMDENVRSRDHFDERGPEGGIGSISGQSLLPRMPQEMEDLVLALHDW